MPECDRHKGKELEAVAEPVVCTHCGVTSNKFVYYQCAYDGNKFDAEGMALPENLPTQAPTPEMPKQAP